MCQVVVATATAVTDDFVHGIYKSGSARVAVVSYDFSKWYVQQLTKWTTNFNIQYGKVR